MTDDLAIKSGFTAVADVVVEIEHLGERADVVAGGIVALDHAGDPLVAFGAAGADLFKPRGPGDDLKGLALGISVEPS